MNKELAFFKIGPSKTLPIRPGPIQCVRNCPSCILRPVLNDDPEAEGIIAVRSYENLSLRISKWLSPYRNVRDIKIWDEPPSESAYQRVQYHLGQVDLLKRTLSNAKPGIRIYFVAVSRVEDIYHVMNMLKHEGLLCHINSNDPCCIILKPLICDQDFVRGGQGSFLVPIFMPCCPTLTKHSDSCGNNGVREIRDFMSVMIELYKEYSTSITLVPVAITKDHNRTGSLMGAGSLCIQILEPYSLSDYVNNLKSPYKAGHIVQHLYHDLAMNNCKLASHIVAFLLLFLDRPEGVTHEDLVEYMDWMRKSSMELNLHLGFTGKTEDAIAFGLMMLSDYINTDKKSKALMPVDNVALMSYAYIIIPNIVYYGLIGRAILMLHNRDDKNVLQVKFNPEVGMKVMKDDLQGLSQDLAESIDLAIPGRRPCSDVRSCIVDTMTKMQTFGHYFRIQDALIRQSAGRVWAGDFDSDDEYYESKKDDPAFKPWIIMTRRPYRLDRLNLFMNAIEPYLANNTSSVLDEIV